jgi:hypothetical protein
MCSAERPSAARTALGSAPFLLSRKRARSGLNVRLKRLKMGWYL